MPEYERRDLEDVLVGAALLGSGGGGPIRAGQEMIREIVAATGGRVQVLPPPFDALRDGDLVVVVCDVGGSQGALPGQAQATWRAFETLAESLGRRPDAVVPIEVGPENSLAPMWVAARARIPVLDGDGARRAVPRLGMTGFAAAGRAPGPAALAGIEGPSAVFQGIGRAELLEQLLRPLLAAPGTPLRNSAGLALWPLSGAEARKVVVPGGLELARCIGAALRQRGQRDPMEVLQEIPELGARGLARGRLRGRDRGGDGLDRDEIVLEEDSGRLVRAFSVNELLIAWRDDAPRPLATAPDLLALMTAEGEPFTLAEVGDHVGEEVVLVGAKAVKVLREEGVLALFREALLELGYAGAPVDV